MTLPLLAILLTGFVLGLLGGGGSILTVPILVYLFKLSAVTATAYSLFIVGSAACLGAFKNYQSNNLDLRTGVLFATPGVLGVFISRALIVPNLPEVIYNFNSFQLSKDNFILIVFATMMVLASYSMIFGRAEKKESKSLNKVYLAALGLIVGVVTGFVGAGGGFIIIPVLNRFAGLKIKKAIGTSLFIIALNSLIGFLGDVITIDPDWMLLFKLSSLALLGVWVGTYFNSKVPAKYLKKGFGFFVLILGSWIIYNQILN
jgi:uncharacterized membrane protein YfcA